MSFAYEHTAYLLRDGAAEASFPLLSLSAESPAALADRLDALAAEATAAASALRSGGAK